MQEPDLCRSSRAAYAALIQCCRVHGRSCRITMLNPLVRGLLFPERIVASVKVTVTKQIRPTLQLMRPVVIAATEPTDLLGHLAL